MIKSASVTEEMMSGCHGLLRDAGHFKSSSIPSGISPLAEDLLVMTDSQAAYRQVSSSCPSSEHDDYRFYFR